jgi:tetratricopeptide (TPR) repeat protein
MDARPDQIVAQARERFALQDYYGCIHLLEEMVGRGEGFADAHHLLGLSYHLSGQADRALASFDRALALNPRYLEAHLHRGLVLNDMGRPEEAQRAFATARQNAGAERDGIPAHHASKLANHHAELGDAYLEAGALPRAIEQYQAALRLGPAFHDLRFRLARLLLDAGRSLEAKEELERVLADRPGFAEARAALGLAHFLSGDPGMARSIWTALHAERPDDPRPRAYLAMLERGDVG